MFNLGSSPLPLLTVSYQLELILADFRYAKKIYIFCINIYLGLFIGARYCHLMAGAILEAELSDSIGTTTFVGAAYRDRRVERHSNQRF